MLDRLAHRYGTDPYRVLGWSPSRLRLALDCLDVHDDDVEARVSDETQRVVDMGSL